MMILSCIQWWSISIDKLWHYNEDKAGGTLVPLTSKSGLFLRLGLTFVHYKAWRCVGAPILWFLFSFSFQQRNFHYGPRGVLPYKPFQILLDNFLPTFRILGNVFVRTQLLATFQKTSTFLVTFGPLQVLNSCIGMCGPKGCGFQPFSP